MWGAIFTLSQDPEPYARAWRLLQLVGGWRATEVEVAGSPEPLVPVVSMALCAREWLRRVGACRAAFPVGPFEVLVELERDELLRIQVIGALRRSLG